MTTTDHVPHILALVEARRAAWRTLNSSGSPSLAELAPARRREVEAASATFRRLRGELTAALRIHGRPVVVSGGYLLQLNLDGDGPAFVPLAGTPNERARLRQYEDAAGRRGAGR